ncbi:MAG: guanosine-3,5-bis(diphosphate) 3-pyrophosphohydrolase [Blastocatellia bacterium]|nr:guanosine-3,5-bis(diphosphate) 3-pyrophosphohydrolase [Blastocatellia bacterium]
MPTSPYVGKLWSLLHRAGEVTDPVILQAAILHDTIEDTNVMREELDGAFGPEVRRVVEEVTDDKALTHSHNIRKSKVKGNR